MGIEAHICVTQTALDLLAEGHKVYVLADGVSSCHEGEVGVALRRLAREGVVITTSEGWLYECMGDAAIEEYVFPNFLLLLLLPPLVLLGSACARRGLLGLSGGQGRDDHCC